VFLCANDEAETSSSAARINFFMFGNF